MSKWRAFSAVLSVLLVITANAAAGQAIRAQEPASNELVYHQLTNRTKGTNSLGRPILSGDGKKAVYAESGAQLQDPKNPNRIFVIDTVTGTSTEVDVYEALCFCDSIVDISDDGSQVVSTDKVQIRAAGRTNYLGLLRLNSTDITSVKISGDGDTVFYVVRRDTSDFNTQAPVKQGVYAMSVHGGEPRLLVGAEEIAAAVGVPLASAIGVFHFDGSAYPMDVTSDGNLVAFAAFAAAGDYIFTVPGTGGTPQLVAGPFDIVTHVAVNDDGAMLAWNMVQDGSYDLGILRNGKTTTLLDIGNETYQPLQLSADGRWLLVGTDGSLIDTDSLIARPLATSSQWDPNLGFLRAGLDRVSMSNDAIRFLYVLGQPSLNSFEQLGTVGLGTVTGGDQPFVRDVRIDPKEIPIDGSKYAKATVSLSWNGQLSGLGLVAIHLGEIDPNIVDGHRFVDSNGPDPNRGEGIFTNETIYYSQQVVRDDDTGPMTLRVYAEVKGEDGRFHAIAIDFGTLTVVGP